MSSLKPGTLKERVGLEMRDTVSLGSGNYQTEFVPQFERRAGFVYAGGSEGVAAERLQGKTILKIRLRSDRQTREITSDWQLRDLRRGTVYAIRSVDAVGDPQAVYLIVASGEAS